MAEVLRRIFRRHQPQQESETFEPYVVEAVPPEQAQLLERQCEEDIVYKYFNGKRFNCFISNMHSLLGYTQYLADQKASEKLEDTQNGRVYTLKRVNGPDLDYGVVVIEPNWYFYSEEEQETGRDKRNIERPIAHEYVYYGEDTGRAIMPLSATPQAFCRFDLVPKGRFPISFRSHVFEDTVNVVKNFAGSEFKLDPRDVQRLCQDVYSAYQRQKVMPLSPPFFHFHSGS